MGTSRRPHSAQWLKQVTFSRKWSVWQSPEPRLAGQRCRATCRWGKGVWDEGPRLVLESRSRSRPGHFPAFSRTTTPGCKGIWEMSDWAAMSPERGRTDLGGKSLWPAGVRGLCGGDVVGSWTWSRGRWPRWPRERGPLPCGQNALWSCLCSRSTAWISSAGSCSCTPPRSCRPTSCSSSKCEPRAPEDTRLPGTPRCPSCEAELPRPLGCGRQGPEQTGPPLSAGVCGGHPRGRQGLADLAVGRLPCQVLQPLQTPAPPRASPLPPPPASAQPAAVPVPPPVVGLSCHSPRRRGLPQARTVTSGDTCLSDAEHRGLGSTDSRCKSKPQRRCTPTPPPCPRMARPEMADNRRW